MIKARLLITLFVFSMLSFAQLQEVTTYKFDSTAQQKQFETMIEGLRCLVCQNESLWDSHAPLAKDLRTEIYKKIKKGEREQDIKDYLVTRYGQFILFKPEFNPVTYFLWVIPFVLLVCGFVIVGVVVSRSKRANKK